MKQTENMNSILRQNANYKNFDTGDYKYALSQSEKADYYRERAMHTTVGNVMTGVGVAATVAGMGLKGVATVAMATGGADAMKVISATEKNVINPVADMGGSVGRKIADRGIDAGYAHARENRNKGVTVAQPSQPKKAPTKRVFTDGPVQSGLDPTMQALHDQARVGRAAQEEWRRKNGK